MNEIASLLDEQANKMEAASTGHDYYRVVASIGIEIRRKAAAEIRRLEQENFALAAGQCVVKDGLLAGEGGTPYCQLDRSTHLVQRELAKAVERAEYAWKNTKTIDSQRMAERAKLDEARELLRVARGKIRYMIDHGEWYAAAETVERIDAFLEGRPWPTGL